MKLTSAAALMLAAALGQARIADAAGGGFGELSVKPAYITPRGLLVTDTGITTQVLRGDVWPLSDTTTLVAGLWTDFDFGGDNTAAANAGVGDWKEFDYFLGATWVWSPRTHLGLQYVAFLSPPGDFKAEHNLEFTLSHDDSVAAELAFKPYAKLFWALAGDSTVVTGRRGQTFDVELGAVPTVTVGGFGLSLPTWLTLGPASFWNGGASRLGLEPSGNNLGVFSSGLSVRHALAMMPARFGHWSLLAGVQCYALLNGNLVDANKLTTGGAGRRQVVNAQAGIAFDF